MRMEDGPKVNEEDAHLTEKAMKEDDMRCEACNAKNALEFDCMIASDKTQVYACQQCGHHESFLSNGKRKENPKYSKYC